MNFSDYLHRGQVIDLELENRSSSPKYMARVEELLDNALAVSIIDEEISPGQWEAGNQCHGGQAPGAHRARSRV